MSDFQKVFDLLGSWNNYNFKWTVINEDACLVRREGEIEGKNYDADVHICKPQKILEAVATFESSEDKKKAKDALAMELIGSAGYLNDEGKCYRCEAIK